MRRRSTATGWALAIGGVTVVGGLLIAGRARAAVSREGLAEQLPELLPGEQPAEELPAELLAEPAPRSDYRELALPELLVDPQDVEAGARMLASENPRGSRRLHVEQLWTQIRSAKRGQSLFDRITAGSGWGPQGGRRAPGLVRPVATSNGANDAQRELVRAVLEGREPSILPGARKFFEPAQQDKAFAIAEKARAKKTQGQALSAQEQRLLRYKRDAAGVRAKWSYEKSRAVGTIDGVEFWT